MQRLPVDFAPDSPHLLAVHLPGLLTLHGPFFLLPSWEAGDFWCWRGQVRSTMLWTWAV